MKIFSPLTFLAIIATIHAQNTNIGSNAPTASNTVTVDTGASSEEHVSVGVAVSQSSLLQHALEEAKAHLAENATTIKSLQGDLLVAESPERRRQEMQMYLTDHLKGTDASVYRNKEFIVVRVPEATFKSGSKSTPEDIKKILSPIATTEIKNSADFDLMIEGHTDASPVRTATKFGNNWQVGFARAEDVASLLQKMTLRTDSITIASRANNLPVSNDPNAKENRRVEFVFMPKRNAQQTNTVVAQPQTNAVTPVPQTNAVAATKQVPSADVAPSPSSSPSLRVSKKHIKHISDPSPNPTSASVMQKSATSLDPEGDAMFKSAPQPSPVTNN